MDERWAAPRLERASPARFWRAVSISHWFDEFGGSHDSPERFLSLLSFVGVDRSVGELDDAYVSVLDCPGKNVTGVVRSGQRQPRSAEPSIRRDTGGSSSLYKRIAGTLPRIRPKTATSRQYTCPRHKTARRAGEPAVLIDLYPSPT